MIGVGSYAFFWQQSDRVPEPLSLIGAFEATRALGVDLFQICDYAPFDRMSDEERRDAVAAARELHLTIELGTKGIRPEHLREYLRFAELFDATLVRSMVTTSGGAPDLDQAATWLGDVMPDFEAAGVTLALETYEQLSTAHLVSLVDGIGSDRLGICLDPANVVARLEQPQECVAQAARLTKNVHVKDFAFARQDGWVGFTYSGVRLGDGLHDYPALLAAVRPRARGVNEIVEHWLPWQRDARTTIRMEQDWTRSAIDYLRSL